MRERKKYEYTCMGSEKSSATKRAHVGGELVGTEKAFLRHVMQRQRDAGPTYANRLLSALSLLPTVASVTLDPMPQKDQKARRNEAPKGNEFGVAGSGSMEWGPASRERA